MLPVSRSQLEYNEEFCISMHKLVACGILNEFAHNWQKPNLEIFECRKNRRRRVAVLRMTSLEQSATCHLGIDSTKCLNFSITCNLKQWGAWIGNMFGPDGRGLFCLGMLFLFGIVWAIFSNSEQKRYFEGCVENISIPRSVPRSTFKSIYIGRTRLEMRFCLYMLRMRL